MKRTIEAKRVNICSFCAIIHLRSSLLIDDLVLVGERLEDGLLLGQGVAPPFLKILTGCF